MQVTRTPGGHYRVQDIEELENYMKQLKAVVKQWNGVLTDHGYKSGVGYDQDTMDEQDRFINESS